MKQLILIPARGGSTRVRDKNLRDLDGKPLLAHVVETAVQAECGRVIVSTNSEQIAEVARQFGGEVPFLRPAELSTAQASSLSCILHALVALETEGPDLPDLVAFCPPTNPLLRSQTIRAMFERLESMPAFNSIVTITKPLTHPFRIIRKHDDGRIVNGVISIDGKTVNEVERSQDWPEVWEGSPACRLSRTRYFLGLLKKTTVIGSLSGKTYDVSSCLGHEILPDEAFDIDEEDDFVQAAFWLGKRRQAGLLQPDAL